MDKARNQDAFERLLFATIAHETEPLEGVCACDAETLISSVAGELSTSEEERLAVHLLLCPACAKEYASIEKALQQDVDRLSAQIRVPSLAEYARGKRAGKGGWRVLISLFSIEQHRLRSLFALVVAALVIASAVIIPLRYFSRRGPSIPADGQMIAKGDSTISSTNTVITELTPQSLVDKLDSMAGYEPWRATAFIIGYLRSFGVPLGSASLVFEHQIAYTAGSGDTWRTVARKALGDADLWPIIILLNHNHTQQGEFPPVGTILRVPAAEGGLR